MFHRVPFISLTSFCFVAISLALAALSSFSSPQDTSHASHGGSLPTVSIKSVAPAVGEEGGRLRVTVKLSRPLTADENYCYAGSPNNGNDGRVCIQGGIIVWDSYNDHFQDEGPNVSDRSVKFIFQSGETEKRLGFGIPDDECITPDRTIRIRVNWMFDDSDIYGYTIENTEHTVPIAGNDEENGITVDDGGQCPAVDEGATEDIPVNHAPAFGTNPIERSVDENTGSGEDIGAPVTANDEENDTLTYSLTGTDASHFDIESSTGQILTDGELDHETKDTYYLAVQVTDGKNVAGDPDSAIDDSIDVTVTVDDVDEPPVFDSGIPTSLNVIENTPAGENIGDPVTATDPEKLAVTYQLDTGDGASFDIDSSGQIKTKADLMDRTQSTYNVTVTASDPGGNEAEHDVTISVTDANDPPAFKSDQGDVQTSTTREVAENTASGQPVGDPVTATDDENDTLTYSLGGTDAASFDFDKSTGQIKVKDPLDFETGTTSYSVTVSVTDGKDLNGNAEDPPVDDASIDVTIAVTNIDVPAVPVAPTVTLANGAATELDVSWTAVTATTTAPVDGYDLHYREKDATPTDDWSEMSVTTNHAAITSGLDYGKTYEVQVRSRNNEGKSAWSPSGDGSIPNLLEVSFSSSNYSTTEGGDTTVTVNVSPAADRDLVIPVTLSAGTAEAGDFSPTSTAVSIASGNSSGSFLVSTTNDSDRSAETVNIAFGTPPLAVGTGLPLAATLTIDDTTPAPRNTDPVSNNGGNSNSNGNTKPPNINLISQQLPRANQAPTFSDGNSTERSVAEMSPEGTNIGHPVRATDTDNDNLNFSLDGTDSESFSIVSGTGQLKTKAELDFELKNTYSVSVSVSDGKGGNDSISVTIRVTDVVEVPVTDEEHQVVVLVDPDDETEVTTVGEDGTITFPQDTRAGLFFVRIDTNPDNCDWDSLDDPPAETLQACVKVEVFDTQGNPITGGNVLDPAISIAVVLDSEDVGTDTVAAFLSSSGGWTSVTFTQTTGDAGDITVSVDGITGPGTYGIGSNSAAAITIIVPPRQPETSLEQNTVQDSPAPPPVPTATPEPTMAPTPVPQPAQAATPMPAVTPQPTPTPGPTPTTQPTPVLSPTAIATVTPTPVPSPTTVPQPTPKPTPMPPPTVSAATPEQQSGVEEQSLRVAAPDIVDLGNAAGSGVPQVTYFGDDDLVLRIWPVILIVLGIAMVLVALGLFLRKREKETDRRRL